MREPVLQSPIRPQCSRPIFAAISFWASLSVRLPNLVQAGGNLPLSSPVVASHPFVSVPTQGGQPPATVQFVEGGPPSFSFCEMLFDSCCASDDQSGAGSRMLGALRFVLRVPQHDVSGSVLISGSALGNRPMLRCGALYHVAYRTVTYHGVARGYLSSKSSSVEV